MAIKSIYAPTDVKELSNYLGELFDGHIRDAFEKNLQSNQRVGQAFFNALPLEYREKLRGTPFDTFYSKAPHNCFIALDWMIQ